MKTHRAATLLTALIATVFGLESHSFAQQYGEFIIGETVIENAAIQSTPMTQTHAAPMVAEYYEPHQFGYSVFSNSITTTPTIITHAEVIPETLAAPVVSYYQPRPSVANEIHGHGVVVEQAYSATPEQMTEQTHAEGITRHINGVPTLISPDYAYDGPGDMRTHLWNDHKNEMMSHGFSQAQVEAMSLQSAQKWHNFFHGTGGLPSK